jgi:hypothetical protein
MLEDPATIDFITEPEGNKLGLVIADPGNMADEVRRFECLKAKLMTYLGFVMSEEFAEELPAITPPTWSMK